MPVALHEPGHKYVNDETGEVYTSVSTLLKLYTPVFDPNGEIAAGCARKRSKELGRTVTVEEIKAEWKKKADISTERGTYIHALLEDFIKKGKTVPIYDKNYNAIAKFSKESFDGQLQSELCVWMDEYKLAGTMDLAEFIPGEVPRAAVYDFKTNAKINYTSRYENKRGEVTYEHLLGPLSHLQNCEWVKYSLQMSIYSYMLELKGYTMNTPYIFWVQMETNKEYDEFIGADFAVDYKLTDMKRIACPYLRSDVINLLNDYKTRYLKPVKEPALQVA